ncbi:MAG: alpha/beta hydrolase [Erysipelotrichaceae bacterium]|nr:alpha/beta hydrolase [Erysipelotrichaceae bacterium]MBO4537865.1 alpha/beta hydrolase [Erysipelotrichaceae bacterium]
MYNFVYTYENMPKWTDTAEGAEILEIDQNVLYPSLYPPVTFAVKNDYQLHIRFIFPEGRDLDRKYPLIIHVKGSGWEEQNLENCLAGFEPYLRAGYGCAVVQYRPWRVAKYPAQVLDLKTAARYILKNAADYPIDVSNIFLSGDSSGGHTAIMGFLTWGEPVLDDLQESDPLPALRGLIDYYGVTNVHKLAYTETGLVQPDNELLLDMLFEKRDESEYAQANFACYSDLLEQLPPVLIMHGNKDRLVSLDQSIDLYNTLKARGVDCQLCIVNNADHGRFSFWQKPVTDRVLEFLKKNTR